LQDNTKRSKDAWIKDGRVHSSMHVVMSRLSGSDIAVVVRDALMEPIRKVQSATHFKPVYILIIVLIKGECTE